MPEHLVALDASWSVWRRAALRSTGLPMELVQAFATVDLLGGPAGPAQDRAVEQASTAAVLEALRDDTFLAALTWQNPAVVESWAGQIAAAVRRGESPTMTKRSVRERVIARYVQRYCTKNESIGFFGPVAWAQFADTDERLRCHGRLGLRRSTVHFEVWALAALAAAWRDDPRLLPHLPVRLEPASTVDGRLLRRPRRPATELDDAALTLLAALDRADRYADVLAAAAETRPDQRERLAGRLAELCEQGIVQVGFAVPFDEWPERHLRRQVAQVPAAGGRAELVARLDALERSRDALAAVVTDPTALPDALGRFNASLTAAGGVAWRGLVGMQRGRAGVYVDCRRDLDVEIGTPLLDQLRAPLGILLDSARWLAAEVAAAVSDALGEQYRWLYRRGEPVTLADLQLAAAHALVPGNQVVADVAEDFQLRWAEILPDAGPGPAVLASAEIRPVVEVLFPDRPPVWAAARQHSPDLMLCRYADGRYGWVMGELHVAMNTIESRALVTQSDEPQWLIDATAVDFAGGRVMPLYPLDAAVSSSRTYPPTALDPPGLYHYWSYGSDQGHQHGVTSVAATAVRVVERAGELFGVMGNHQARITEFFGEFLTALTVNLFKLRRTGRSAPRVLIDDVVVCRATWRCPAGEVPVAPSRTRDYTHQSIREWAAGLGIPRYAFLRTPLEPKPVYVDFAAPALLDNMASLVRVAARQDGAQIELVEMLPGPDQLWLTDPAGRHYSAEFRLVAVDPRATAPVVTRAG